MGKSQLGGKASYYSDKYKLCASTHTSHIPPMFQSKTVLYAQLKHRSCVGHYPQTGVLPVGFRGTAVLLATLLQDAGSELWGML